MALACGIPPPTAQHAEVGKKHRIAQSQPPTPQSTMLSSRRRGTAHKVCYVNFFFKSFGDQNQHCAVGGEGLVIFPFCSALLAFGLEGRGGDFCSLDPRLEKQTLSTNEINIALSGEGGPSHFHFIVFSGHLVLQGVEGYKYHSLILCFQNR